MKEPAKMNGFKKAYPEKFGFEDSIFSHIHRGNRIFVGTGSGELQYLEKMGFDIKKRREEGVYEMEMMFK